MSSLSGIASDASLNVGLARRSAGDERLKGASQAPEAPVDGGVLAQAPVPQRDRREIRSAKAKAFHGLRLLARGAGSCAAPGVLVDSGGRAATTMAARFTPF